MDISVLTDIDKQDFCILIAARAVQASHFHFQFIQEYKWTDLSHSLLLSPRLWSQAWEAERQKGRLWVYILDAFLKKELLFLTNLISLLLLLKSCHVFRWLVGWFC